MSAYHPARHLAAADWHTPLWYLPEPPDGSDPPVPLDAKVAGWRAAVERGRSREPAGRALTTHTAVLSHERATVIAALLRELSKRMRPGFTAGPIESAGELSALAEELAADLRRRAG
ncbi:hypothetical protein [Actinoplanes sp. L3-i22]|uniref:hypothetical protein n=1 Tax=Actinoplanes sp. L3-i22 TaxID=2836373 RepID=UPI001C744CDC|nr:hypothetical protein [Actinoplanes sp. L3-i22]BCY11783.1 hypothetical protein L3i22_068710 [Actinoplanes sp. L3-i22]